MTSFMITVGHESGMHARPAGELVKMARQFESRITVTANGKAAEATRLMALMALGINKGHRVQVCAEGIDETAACAAMKVFFETNLQAERV